MDKADSGKRETSRVRWRIGWRLRSARCAPHQPSAQVRGGRASSRPWSLPEGRRMPTSEHAPDADGRGSSPRAWRRAETTSVSSSSSSSSSPSSASAPDSRGLASPAVAVPPAASRRSTSLAIESGIVVTTAAATASEERTQKKREKRRTGARNLLAFNERCKAEPSDRSRITIRRKRCAATGSSQGARIRIARVARRTEEPEADVPDLSSRTLRP